MLFRSPKATRLGVCSEEMWFRLWRCWLKGWIVGWEEGVVRPVERGHSWAVAAVSAGCGVCVVLSTHELGLSVCLRLCFAVAGVGCLCGLLPAVAPHLSRGL